MTVPGSDMAVHGSDMTAPGSDMAAPGSDTTAPGSDMTAPGSDMTAPGSDMAVPGSDNTPPGLLGFFFSPSNGVAPDNFLGTGVGGVEVSDLTRRGSMAWRIVKSNQPKRF